MKTTYEKLNQYLSIANNWLEKHNQMPGNPTTKFAYAIYRLSSRATALIRRYEEEIEALRIDHCRVDKEEIILRDPQGRYRFDKEGLRRLNDAQRALVLSKEIEIEPYYAAKLPTDLTLGEIEAFAGFIIRLEDAVVKEPEESDEKPGTSVLEATAEIVTIQPVNGQERI